MTDGGEGGTLDRDAQRLAELGYKQELTRVWSKFSNFAISFTIISVLAGCFTTYPQAWNLGGPIAISWGWPIVCLIVLTVAFSMAEVASAYPTAGGPYWWANELGGKGWSWFTGWFNLLGLVAIVATVDWFCAQFATTVFNLWGLDFILNFADAVSLKEIFAVFVVILILHALINIYSSHLVALFNNISVFWHCVGVAVIIGILIFVPDKHQSADFVFTERINNSGFSLGMYWYYILPTGLLLTMYTVTGYDASAHVAEETVDAERAAAQGIWQSVALSALIGWFVLLAITFAATDVTAVNDGGRHLARHLHHRDERGLGRDRDPDLDDRPVLLRHGLLDELLADVLRVLARPRHAGLAAVEPGQPQGRAGGRRARVVRPGADHHAPGAVGQQGGRPGGVLRRRLDRRDRALPRLRDPGLPALAQGRRLQARGLDPGQEVQVGEPDRGGLGGHHLDLLLPAVLRPRGGVVG